MSNYAQHLRPKSTPQTQPIAGRANMVPNDGGGYSFAVDKWTRLNRFLIMGTEGGHFQVGEEKLTVDSAKAVRECIAEDPRRTVQQIIEISVSGRAAKNDAVVFALALAASSTLANSVNHHYPNGIPNDVARDWALEVGLPKVCRIYTHLADFVKNVTELRGWGRGLRRCVSRWYNDKSVPTLAYQMTKYQNRNGYSQRDMLRLSHPKTGDPVRNELYGWAVGKQDDGRRFAYTAGHPLATLYAFKKAQAATDESEIVSLIRDFRLDREHIPTEYLNSVRVWDALLQHMPATALIRNLGKMTSIGLLSPLSDGAREVVARLNDKDYLAKGRIHPFGVLLAQTTYTAGCGVKGALSWTPNAQIKAALETAFYNSFASVKPSGKRYYLGIDCSGSMAWPSSTIANTHITARVGAACMAMATVRVEEQSYVAGFSDSMIDLGIDATMRIQDVVKITEKVHFGGTDCSAPIRDALDKKIPVDAFVVYTDNDTNSGRSEHPIQALDRYRQATGRGAKLIVVSMASNGSSIADPNDAGTLDVSGFDANTPKLISEFVSPSTYEDSDGTES